MASWHRLGSLGMDYARVFAILALKKYTTCFGTDYATLERDGG